MNIIDKVETIVYNKNEKDIYGYDMFDEYERTVTYLNGNIHSFNDQPAVIWKFPHGNMQKWIWYNHGQIHRDNGYAVETRHFIFVKSEYEWYKNGKLHREEYELVNNQRKLLPAYIYVSADGEELYPEYFIEGIRVNELGIRCISQINKGTLSFFNK